MKKKACIFILFLLFVKPAMPIFLHEFNERLINADRFFLGENFSGMCLRNRRLSRICFSRTHMKKVSFLNTRLCKSKFILTNLTEADLTNANATNARFEKAKMHNVKLTNATLINAQFQNAYMRGADLTNADATGANFENAKMYGIKLDGATVTDANFKGVKGLTNEQKKYLRKRGAINVPTEIAIQLDDSEVGHEVSPPKSINEKLFGFILRRYRYYFQSQNASTQTANQVI